MQTQNGTRPQTPNSSSDTLRSAMRAVETNLSSIIQGKSADIELILIALASGGHVLLEDAPGTGKTTLAKAIAASMDGIFRRVQFTPDLLPADITGSSFYNPADGSFEFRPGPVFSNVLLADEINRTSPRTQSALLEVMGENQVSTDGKRHALPLPFFVVATQNPSDYAGTYPLPEAQLDRFMLRVSLGYPDAVAELSMLYAQNTHHPLEDLRAVVSTQTILDIQEEVKKVRFDEGVGEYVVRLIHATRGDSRLRIGLSPRGSLALYRTSQARAWWHGRDFVVPEDVRALAVPTLAHRLVLDTKARYGGASSETIIGELLESVAVPR
ncbi:MoxR-like ATPase [Abditibacterium utsteinense]|uniref:MoxR-like ATPase n=1 Tax=Abditibacterium utsteinense TaxID=1960156 RepID=A0A2S8SV95_9BACT|nr:MoxR family ATPase [Abditibacterium utsteinense]PQV64699.1 MoxR-like ATPase [Abditibacterium utsteinense]